MTIEEQKEINRLQGIELEKISMLEMYCNAIGWQGGTYNQVLVEIVRLKELETLTRQLMDCLAFRSIQKKFKPYKDELEILKGIQSLARK